VSLARALLGAAAIAVVLGAAASHARSSRAATSPVTSSAGPTDARAPDGAVFAEDGNELRAMLADDHGPAMIALHARVYAGDFVIKRPVAIYGTRGAVLEGSGRDTVLTIDAHDVAIEDITIRHSGRKFTTEDAAIKARGENVRIARVETLDTLFGISFQMCKRCVLERAHVTGLEDEPELRGDGVKLWETDDAIVRGCLVERSRDLVVWYSRRAQLEENVVTASRYGTHFMYAHDSAVRKSRVIGNIVGIFVMYSARLTVEDNQLAGARGAAGMGIGFKESDGVALRRNWIVANTTGVYLDRTPRTPVDPVTFERNVLALNDVALRLHGGEEEGARFVGNDFHENAVVAEVDGGGDALKLAFVGNRFSDYAGYDLDGDGTGDVPYEVKMLSRELTDSRPAMRILQGTAAMATIDAVAHAVPVLAAKKMLVDPRPSMRRPLGDSP
jgi:nitrous oxidase accessory protein